MSASPTGRGTRCCSCSRISSLTLAAWDLAPGVSAAMACARAGRSGWNRGASALSSVVPAATCVAATSVCVAPAAVAAAAAAIAAAPAAAVAAVAVVAAAEAVAVRLLAAGVLVLLPGLLLVLWRVRRPALLLPASLAALLSPLLLHVHALRLQLQLRHVPHR